MFFPRPRATIESAVSFEFNPNAPPYLAAVRDEILRTVLSGSMEDMVEVLAYLSGLSYDEVAQLLQRKSEKGLDALCRVAGLPYPLNELLRQSAILLWGAQIEMNAKSNADRGKRLLERLFTTKSPVLEDIEDRALDKVMNLYALRREIV